MKFGYTLLYVTSVSKTVEFYESAFDMKRRFIHESGSYAEMEAGTATTLGFVEASFAAQGGIVFDPVDHLGASTDYSNPSVA